MKYLQSFECLQVDYPYFTLVYRKNKASHRCCPRTYTRFWLVMTKERLTQGH